MRHALLAPWQVHCMCDKWPSSTVCQLLGEQGEESQTNLRNGNSKMTKNVRERRYMFQTLILGIYVESSWWFRIFNIQALFGGRWTHFHKYHIFQLGWNKPGDSNPLTSFFGVVWFVTFSGLKLSDLQFGESCQKVTNGSSWLYQLMVNN